MIPVNGRIRPPVTPVLQQVHMVFLGQNRKAKGVKSIAAGPCGKKNKGLSLPAVKIMKGYAVIGGKPTVRHIRSGEVLQRLCHEKLRITGIEKNKSFRQLFYTIRLPLLFG
jgi:hypothetical protein